MNKVINILSVFVVIVIVAVPDVLDFGQTTPIGSSELACGVADSLSDTSKQLVSDQFIESILVDFQENSFGDVFTYDRQQKGTINLVTPAGRRAFNRFRQQKCD